MLNSYIQLLLGFSIPHTLVRIWFVFAAAGLKPKQHAGKLVLFAVAGSLVIDLDYGHVPAPVHALTSMLISLAFLFFLFRKLGGRSLFILFIAYTSVSFLTDTVGSMLIQLFYGMTERRDVLLHYPLAAHSVYVPLGAALGLLAWYLEKRSFPLLHRLYQYLWNIQQSRMKEVVFLATLQIFLLGLLFTLVMEKGKRGFPEASLWTIYALVLLTFCSIFYMLRLIVRIREDAIVQTRDVYAEEIGQMFTVIRGHRHDFLNHMQVMSSMLQMNKIDQLKSYMEDLAKESHAVAAIVQHPSPALAAFVIGKTEQARSRDIPFAYDIPANLNIGTSVKIIDLVKIMGNLVDNAFEESDTLPPGNRKVSLAIREEDGKLALEVNNRGRGLSDDELRMMIMPGYTTKSAGHSGLGLAIVQERVHYYQGELSIRSCAEHGTTIRAELPLKS